MKANQDELSGWQVQPETNFSGVKLLVLSSMTLSGT